MLLGRLDLPGDAIDISIDDKNRIAIVAGNSGGLHFVDIRNLGSPQLIRTLKLTATQVEVFEGVVLWQWVMNCKFMNTLTAEVLQKLPLGNAPITSLVREGNVLVTIDSARRLRTIRPNPFGDLAVAGFLDLSVGGKLFVGDGIVYVTGQVGDVGNQGGYATVDIQDVTNPALISGVQSNSLAGRAIANNGSGLGVFSGHAR